ncbi:MAG: hypothetical protein PHF51_04365 [Candidatus ainarchaeum sp.]|nr:hypothetical protein [Candidatus ainarchaeum sp.]
MILGLLYLALTFAVGWLALSFLGRRMRLVELLALVFPLGFGISAASCFAIVLFLHLPYGLLVWVVAALALVFFARGRLSWEKTVSRLELALIVFALLLAGFNFYRLQLEPTGHSYLASRIAFNDNMLHNAMVSSFAYGDNYPPEEPFLAGFPLHYHFFINFYSGMLLYGGLGFWESFVFPEIFLLASAILGIYAVTNRLAGSRAASLFAVALLLFNGNLAVISALEKSPGAGPYEIGNIISDMYGGAEKYFGSDELLATMTPLRALVGGLPVFIAGLLLVVIGVGLNGKADDRRALALAGMAAGVSPLIHGFCFPCLGIVGGILILLFARDKARALAWFAVPALLLGGIEFLFIFSTGTPKGYPHFNLFYMAEDIPSAVMVWVRNWSPFIFLVLAGIGLANYKQKMYYLAPLALFALVNTVQYQPFEIDNQVIFLWYAASVPLAALFLGRLWENGKAGALVALMLLSASMISGMLVWYYHANTRYEVYSDGEFGFAEWLRGNTPPKSVVLTAIVHTHPASILAGRRMLVGIGSYTDGRGLNELAGRPVNYHEKEAALKRIYSGAPGADADLLGYGVNYVVVSPYELYSDYISINETFFADRARFEKVYDEFIDGREWRVFRAAGVPPAG